MSTNTVDWQEAGRGWGARATEWAYLWEPYALPANEVLFDRLGVDEGIRLLDIACGSGFAAAVAARRGRGGLGNRRVRTTHRDRGSAHTERELSSWQHVRAALPR